MGAGYLFGDGGQGSICRSIQYVPFFGCLNLIGAPIPFPHQVGSRLYKGRRWGFGNVATRNCFETAFCRFGTISKCLTLHLKANRFDIITGGMYILEARCESIDFSEPMGIFGDAFVVPAGNPKNITSYADIKDQGATMVTGAGYNTVDAAKREGVAADQILEVPGPTEILATMRVGRADAGAVTFFTGKNLAAQSNGKLEVTDPNALPEWTQNWVGIGFRPEDSDFLAAFNAAQVKYLGSEEMLAAVAPYEYTNLQVPDPSVTTEWICQNR